MKKELRERDSERKCARKKSKSDTDRAETKLEIEKQRRQFVFKNIPKAFSFFYQNGCFSFFEKLNKLEIGNK